ncbi:MAG TPA: PH domain-containing protein [Sporichthyaceae bacterium]
MSRVLGLGPLRRDTLADSRPVVMRQPVAVGTGAFLMLIMIGFAGAILADPGKTVGSGSAFLDRWFFGIMVVPCAWGIDRFLLRPRVRVDNSGVTFHNPVQTISTPWPAVAGAAYDSHLTLALTDHDQLRSVLFGPALSGPMTRENRPTELVALINTESARRAGNDAWTPDARYDAQPLIGTEPEAAIAAPRGPVGPSAVKAPAYGVPSLLGYLAAWTVACILAAQ